MWWHPKNICKSLPVLHPQLLHQMMIKSILHTSLNPWTNPISSSLPFFSLQSNSKLAQKTKSGYLLHVKTDSNVLHVHGEEKM